MSFEITGDNVSLDALWRVAWENESVALHDDARHRVEASRQFIERSAAEGQIIYGVNTGFGAFSSVRISDADLRQLQVNLIRSHCVGVGDLFSEPEARAILLLRASMLARGHSGIRTVVIEKLIEFLNRGVTPVIPQQGSVGASGDLAPLAHVGLALIGEGEVFHRGRRAPASEVLQQLGIQPLVLEAKEGLSIINGCQVMTAYGLLKAGEIRRLCLLADIAGAMSLEALRGTRAAFHPGVSQVRPHPGQGRTARNLLKILGTDSPLGHDYAKRGRVQDVYSLRCMPQVHGTTKDALEYALRVLETEANSTTDNPIVFTESGEIVSCGNFHGAPVAAALDFLAIAVCSLASISECRIDRLTNPAMSGLPAFLTRNGGLNSGLMLVQVAAAALVSENKIHAHPASVDNIPTSADKEDHVSMGTIAALKLGRIVANAENVIAMELLSAAQGLDFHKPLAPVAGVEAAYRTLRTRVQFAEEDRIFYPDIDAIRGLMRSGELLSAVTDVTGPLEV